MVDELKRYSPAGSAVMQEMTGGKYVRAEDYDALRAEVAALKAMYEGPLTVSDLAAVMINVGPIGDRSPARFVGDIDAAIRAAREGER